MSPRLWPIHIRAGRGFAGSKAHTLTVGLFNSAAHIKSFIMGAVRDEIPLTLIVAFVF